MSWFRTTFTALGERNYRLLWSGSLFATTAFMMSFMLVPSVAFDLTGRNTAAGIAQLGLGVAMFTIAPIGGVIADRVRKKWIVLIGQTVPGLIILLTGLLILTDSLTIPILTATTLVMGLGFAFMGPARQAWVGELVPRPLLPNAIALQQIAQNISQVAGPLLIALLVSGALGIGGTYVFMASLFVVVLPLTFKLPNTEPATARADRRPIRTELFVGIRYVIHNPRLRTLWLAFIGLVVCGFAFQTLLPGLLDTELGRAPTDIGLIFLVFAIAGLIVNLPLAGVVHTRWAWPALLTMGALMALGFVLLSSAPTYALVILTGIPLGIGRAGFMLLNNALTMSYAEPRYYGRVMSLSMMAFGTQALLSPVWGAVADTFGVRETFFVVGIVAGVVTALTALSWLRLRAAETPAPAAVPVGAPAGEPPTPAAAHAEPAPVPAPATPPANIPAPTPALALAGAATTPGAAPATRPALPIPDLPDDGLTLPPPPRYGFAGAVAVGVALGIAAARRIATPQPVRANGAVRTAVAKNGVSSNGHARLNGQRTRNGRNGANGHAPSAATSDRIWEWRRQVADWLDPPLRPR